MHTYVEDTLNDVLKRKSSFRQIDCHRFRNAVVIFFVHVCSPIKMVKDFSTAEQILTNDPRGF